MEDTSQSGREILENKWRMGPASEVDNLSEKWHGEKYGVYWAGEKDQIDIIPTKTKWTAPNQEKEQELDHFSEQCKKEGLFSGTMITLKESRVTIKKSDIDLDFSFGTSSYFEHLAWMRGAVEGLENPKVMLVSVECITSDGKTIFTRRSEKSSAGKGEIGIIGGTFDHLASESSVPDPFVIAEEEITTELGLPENSEEIKSRTKLKTLISDSLDRPVLRFTTKLPYSSQEVSKMFESSSKAKEEHTELIFIHNNKRSMINFANNNPPETFHPPANAFVLISIGEHIANEQAVRNAIKGISSNY